jgi:hypothetical protein
MPITIEGIIHPPGQDDSYYRYHFREKELPQLTKLVVNKPILYKHELDTPIALGKIDDSRVDEQGYCWIKATLKDDDKIWSELVSGHLQGLSLTTANLLRPHARLAEVVAGMAPVEVSVCELGGRVDSHIAWFTNGKQIYVSDNFLKATHITSNNNKMSTNQEQPPQQQQQQVQTTTASSSSAASSSVPPTSVDMASMQEYVQLTQTFGSEQIKTVIAQLGKVTTEAKAKGLQADVLVEGVLNDVSTKIEEREKLITAAKADLVDVKGDFMRSMAEVGIPASEVDNVINIMQNAYEKVPATAILMREITAKRQRTDINSAESDLEVKQLKAELETTKQELTKLKEEQKQTNHQPSFKDTYAQLLATKQQQTQAVPAAPAATLVAASAVVPPVSQAPPAKVLTKQELTRQLAESKASKILS